MNREQRERIKAQAAEQRAAKGAAVADKPTVKADKPKPPPGDKLKYACGHEEGVKSITAHPCGKCRAENRRLRAEKRRAKQANKEPQGQEKSRLPHGSRFESVYDAEKVEWRGTLTLIDGQRFEAAASGVKGLLHALDDLYRRAVKA